MVKIESLSVAAFFLAREKNVFVRKVMEKNGSDNGGASAQLLSNFVSLCSGLWSVFASRGLVLAGDQRSLCSSPIEVSSS